MRQLYESDRKLRALSLIKYSKVSLKDIDNAAKASITDATAANVIAQADSIAAELHLNVSPDANDASVIFYVSGYCCRSLVKGNKCKLCKETTVAAVDDPDEKIDSVVPTSAIEFFDDIDRGGL